MFTNSMKQAVKNHLHLLIDFVLVFLVVLSLIIYLIINNNSYLSISNGQTEDISNLVCKTVNTELDTQLNKPQAIALSMSNDNFIKETLKKEKNNMKSAEFTKSIADYLSAYKKEFKLSSAFLVSDYSKRYYYPGGVDRIMKDTHENSWYYSLRSSKKASEWNVDYDVVGNKKIYTLFVNATITDDAGSVMGVIGTGMNMSSIGNTINELSSQYDMTCLLLDPNGNVIATSDSSISKMADIADYIDTSRSNTASLISNNKSMWLNGKYLCTDHVSATDWHIVTLKSSQGLFQLFFNNKDGMILILSSIAEKAGDEIGNIINRAKD